MCNIAVPPRLGHIGAGAVLCLLAGITQANDTLLSPEVLQQDLATLTAVIYAQHPDAGHSADEQRLHKLLCALEADLDKPMDRVAAWRLLATLNPVLADGHFFVGFADWRGDARTHLDGGGSFFPFEVQVSDSHGVRITAHLGGTPTAHSGRRIESINGVPIAAVEAQLLARVHGDTHRFRQALLAQRWWFYYWRTFGATASFELGFSDDNSSRRRFPGSRAIPEILVDEECFECQFQLHLQSDLNKAVLTINSFYWPDKQHFFDFTRDAFTQIKDAGVTTLIIDVSANSGGDDDLWMQGVLPYIANAPYRWASTYRKRIIERYRDDDEVTGDLVFGSIDREIPPEPGNPLFFSGDVKVRVGPLTYSSAVVFANVVQSYGFATLTGTGGIVRADQTGGVQKAVLPGTGLAVWWPRFILYRPSGKTEPVHLTVFAKPGSSREAAPEVPPEVPDT